MVCLTCMEARKVVSSKRSYMSKPSSSLKVYNGRLKNFLEKQENKKLKSPLQSSGSALPENTRMDFANRKHLKNARLLRRKLFMKDSSLKCEKENSLIISMHNTDKSHRGFITKKSRKISQSKRKRVNVELDEASRLQRRARYQLVKLKLEQNLIDAYLGDGWKGQSREKIRPEEELQRARKHILKCKLGIRDVLHQLDSLSAVGCIETSLMSSDGSVSHEHIFCAKCKLREAFPDNDIILCDGTCNCAFHQNCLDPPLATEHIPPGDQGWLCKFCECKVDILEAMNAHLGTNYSMDSNWQEIFKKEAAIFVDGRKIQNPVNEWPSDDSKDDDYDPSNSTEEYASDDIRSFGSLSWSLEDKVFWGSGNDSKFNSFDLVPTDGSNGVMDHDIINFRRQRRVVDYKKLYDEVFGTDYPETRHVSDDEDWGPAKKKKKKRMSDAANILMILNGENKIPSTEIVEIQKSLPEDLQNKNCVSRIPPGCVEKLRYIFAQNELPSRTVMEKLSRQLGLELEKATVEFGDDVTLKRQLEFIKEKKKMERKKKEARLKLKFGQEAGKEMERLCSLKNRVRRLKLLLPPSPQKRTGYISGQRSVIFVPVAELKEKM